MDRGHEIAEQRLQYLEYRLKVEYATAIEEMMKEHEKTLKKYEKQLKIKHQQLIEGKITKKQFEQWKQEQAVLVDWQRKMIDSLTSNAVNVDNIAMQMLNNEIPIIYAENYNYGTFEVESGYGVDTSFVLINNDTIKHVMDNDLFYKLDIAKDTAWNKRQFETQLIQGILKGEGVRQIAKRFENVMNMDANSALRATRTAITGAENAARIDSYERANSLGLGVRKQWIATLDERTRHSHRLLDKVSIPIDKPFHTEHGSLMFPADPHGHPAEIFNCRCTLVADFMGVDEEELDRFSRLPDGMTYENWKDEHPKPKKSTKK